MEFRLPKFRFCFHLQTTLTEFRRLCNPLSSGCIACQCSCYLTLLSLSPLMLMLETMPLGLGYFSMAKMVLCILLLICCTNARHMKGTTQFQTVNFLEYFQHVRSGDVILMGNIQWCTLTISRTCIFLHSHTSTNNKHGGWKSCENFHRKLSIRKGC